MSRYLDDDRKRSSHSSSSYRDRYAESSRRRFDRSNSRSKSRSRSRSRSRGRDGRRSSRDRRNYNRSPSRSSESPQWKGHSRREERSNERYENSKKDPWMARVWGGDDSNDKKNEQIPNNSIIIENISFNVTEADIMMKIKKVGDLCPKSVRMVCRKDDSAMQRMAMVEFATAQEAHIIITKCEGYLFFGNAECKMRYKDAQDESDFITVSQDWRCQCTAVNFKRRSNCYKCGMSRDEGESKDDQSVHDLVSIHPTNTVVLSNLHWRTDEQDVLKAIKNTSDLPIRCLRIIRDPFNNSSKGQCLLEMNNISDAMELRNLLILHKFKVENRSVSISYGRLSQNVSIGETRSPHKISSAAVAAAQWSHMMATPAQETAYHSTRDAIASTYQPNAENIRRYTAEDIPELADYSAKLYAKTEKEKKAYYKHYVKYYAKLIMEGGTILDAAQSNPSQTGYIQTALVSEINPDPPSGIGELTYPIPDMSKYQLDQSSGYYYDSLTGLYYDPNSKYYYNSKIGKFLYWNLQRRTYLLAPTSNKNENATDNLQNAKEEEVAGGGDEKKAKTEEKDKVKVAKRIAKDMEKWARTLNQRKEIAKQNLVVGQAAPVCKSASIADIGFTVLGKKESATPVSADASTSSTAPVVNAPPPTSKDANPTNNSKLTKGNLVAAYGEGSDESEEETSSNVAEEQQDDQHADFDRMACLLCKRQFNNRETLLKHQQMSDLHKENLQAWYKSRGISLEDASRRTIQYRDRAKERRIKYNQPEKLPPQNSLKDRYLKSATVNYEQPNRDRIGGDNLGNKLLQKMGWSEGMGLGKKNQGTTDIIQANARPAAAGLGSRAVGVTPGPGETYKECVKKMMKARYEETDGYND